MRRPRLTWAPAALLLLFLLPSLGLAAGAASPDEASAPDTFDAAYVFEHTKLDVLDLLTPADRREMVLYFQADSVLNKMNQLEGFSRIEAMTPDYIKVQISQVSTLEVRMLPDASGGRMAVAAYTIGDEASAGDSELFFYDGAMTLYPEKRYFKVPEMKDFFQIPAGSGVRMKDLVQKVPFPTVIYTLSPDDNRLTVELTVGKYMGREDYEYIKPYIRPRLVYEWNGKRFEPLTSN